MDLSDFWNAIEPSATVTAPMPAPRTTTELRPHWLTTWGETRGLTFRGINAVDGLVDERPAPGHVSYRGECPICGEPLVANLYLAEGRGYILAWECWGSMVAGPTCDYRRVI